MPIHTWLLKWHKEVYSWVLMLLSFEILLLPIMQAPRWPGIPFRVYNLVSCMPQAAVLILMPFLLALTRFQWFNGRKKQIALLCGTLCNLICYAAVLDAAHKRLFAMCCGQVSFSFGVCLYPVLFTYTALRLIFCLETSD